MWTTLVVIYVCDFDVSSTGGRRIATLRELTIWRYLCAYFPVRLIKTATLSPSHNYLCGYHPHGLISIGAFAAFATEGKLLLLTHPGTSRKILPVRIPGQMFSIPGYLQSLENYSLQWLIPVKSIRKTSPVKILKSIGALVLWVFASVISSSIIEIA